MQTQVRHYLTPKGQIGRFLGYDVTKTTRMTIYRLDIEGAEVKYPIAVLSEIPADKLPLFKTTKR